MVVSMRHAARQARVKKILQLLPNLLVRGPHIREAQAETSRKQPIKAWRLSLSMIVSPNLCMPVRGHSLFKTCNETTAISMCVDWLSTFNEIE